MIGSRAGTARTASSACSSSGGLAARAELFRRPEAASRHRRRGRRRRSLADLVHPRLRVGAASASSERERVAGQEHVDMWQRRRIPRTGARLRAST